MEIPSTGPQIIDLSEITNVDDEEEDEDLDETLVERLIGLTEMFPEPVRSAFSKVASLSWRASLWGFSFSKSALWVMSSAATIIVLPVMFENERSQMIDHQKQQERQILLGPHSAMSGPPGMYSPGMMSPNMVPAPPQMPPPQSA